MTGCLLKWYSDASTHRVQVKSIKIALFTLKHHCTITNDITNMQKLPLI